MSEGRQKLGLVIPTLNEAGNIPILLHRLSVAVADTSVDCEFIVVDDGSTDGTADVAHECAVDDPRVRVFVRKGERGLAGAVIHGWAQTDADLLGVIDADLQHPPELLPELLHRVLNGSDIAIASRYVNGNKESVNEWNKFRIFVSRCSTLLATAPLRSRGLNVKDPLSGYFVVRRECMDALHLQPEGFKILLEILVKGRIRNATEVPFRFATRQSGKSKADFKVALQYFALLGKLSRHAFFGQGQQ
ncbi:MAG TPA: polyprenol monophosphomannose synthase [Terriglobales bacterium]|nr:polyprenol monophosphomannose synthase [Terriglobales bacterium]